MNGEQETQFFHVNEVGTVDGPVGLDLGIWLNFDTDQGKIRIKLGHEDSIALRTKVEAEVALPSANEET